MNEDRLWQLFTLMHGQAPSSSGGVHIRVQTAYTILQQYEKEVAFLRAKEQNEAEIAVLMVEDLDLPCRVRNCLRAEAVETVDQLCMWTEKNLMRIPNLGQKGVRYIVEELDRHGRSLAKF